MRSSDTPGLMECSTSFHMLIEELVAVHAREVDQLQTEVDRLRQSTTSPSASRRSLSPVRAMSPPLKEVSVEQREARQASVRKGSKDAAELGLASMTSRFSVGTEGLDLDLGSDESSEVVAESQDVAMSRWKAFFLSGTFESIIAGLLFVNICLMAAQLQILGQDMGFDIGYARYTIKPTEVWPHYDEFFFYSDLAFAVIFTIEMMIRQFYLGLTFFKYALNWLDFLVVCSSWVELFAAGLPINPTFLRMLRLGKLLRAIRVVRMSQVLESLQLLLKCIAASVSEYLVDTNIDVDRRREVFRYYGTCTKTLLTMFEVLFANWAPPARVLIDNVSEWYSLVFIIYRCFVGFAVLNVVAQADEDFIVREKKKAEDSYRRKVTTLFRQVDTSGDGKIDAHEFKRLLKAPKLQAWLSQLEIETTDLWGLFNMLDQGEGEISLKDFEDGTMRIKGFARSYDVAQLKASVQRLHTKMDGVLAADEKSAPRKQVAQAYLNV